MDAEKMLPKPEKDLPAGRQDLPLPEKELEQPHDMLLRKPTLFEKFSPSHWLSMGILVLLLLGGTIYALTLKSTSNPTPTISTTPTASPIPTQETKRTTTSQTVSPQPSILPSPTAKIANNNQPTLTPTPPCISDATKSYYTIQGSYVDTNNAPLVLSGQKVTVTNLCTGEVRTSEASPSWSFANLPKSAYRIAAAQIGGYIVHSNNCSGCTFHPNFGGSETTGADFNLNPQNTYEDIGFQYTQQ